MSVAVETAPPAALFFAGVLALALVDGFGTTLGAGFVAGLFLVGGGAGGFGPFGTFLGGGVGFFFMSGQVG